MKKKRLISLFMTAVCMFLLAVPAFAGTLASSQICLYDITVTPITDSLYIKFSISGNTMMDKIGCESIYVYEKSGSRWNLVNSWDEDDEGMSRSNARSNKNGKYSSSETGVEYKVVITVYAEDSNGRDTRTKTVYVTGK